jgi:hypothetical protein
MSLSLRTHFRFNLSNDVFMLDDSLSEQQQQQQFFAAAVFCSSRVNAAAAAAAILKKKTQHIYIDIYYNIIVGLAMREALNYFVPFCFMCVVLCMVVR